jgi:hypothetical protein
MVASGPSVQELLEKLPPLVSEATVTTPVGGVGLDAVSVTKTVHDVAWPMATEPGEQNTPVVVGSLCGTVGFAITASA